MDSIQSFVDRTLAAEKRAADAAQRADLESDARVVQVLRKKLERALGKNDAITALRLTHELQVYLPCDDEIEDLNLFLLDRVGIPAKETVLGFSSYPPVMLLSMALVLIMIFAAVYSLLTEIGDPWLTLGPALVCAIPLLDFAYAWAYNKRNAYRLK